MKLLSLLILLASIGSALAAPQLTTLYSFKGGADGELPNAVTVGADGALYGTTSGGGTKEQGTVFKLSPSVPRRSLDERDECVQAHPKRQAIFAGDPGSGHRRASGRGQRPGGGQHTGTIFRLVPPQGGSGAWTYKIIHDFTNLRNSVFLLTSMAGLRDGHHIDMRPIGAEFRDRVRFRSDAAHKTWTRTLNHVFTGTDGLYPGAIAIGPNGILYGSASQGGAGFGTIFSLDPATAILTTLFEPIQIRAVY